MLGTNQPERCTEDVDDLRPSVAQENSHGSEGRRQDTPQSSERPSDGSVDRAEGCSDEIGDRAERKKDDLISQSIRPGK